MSGSNLQPDMAERLEDLRARVASYGSVAVALSGGIDSVLVLYVCREVLGDRVVAATSVSVTTPEWDIRDAQAAAAALGVRFRSIETQELEIEAYSENSPARCYFCKDELYRRIREIADEEGVAVVADGGNRDDASDHRPGRRAAAALGVRSPLEEAGLGKAEIRALARHYGIEIADKPASACLASRFPYGSRITREDVMRVAKAEAFLRDLGFPGLRVRHHDTIARIEVPPDRIEEIAREPVRGRVASHFRQLGYRYTCLDLDGYRTGSLNEALAPARAFEA